MRNICKHLSSLLMLYVGLTSFAHGQTLVDETMSGSWYDPSHDGEGFVLEVLEDDRAVVYWFTYDEVGAQRWFVATGQVENDTVVFNKLKQSGGGTFGEQFDASDVVFTDVGELTITWADCSTASASYTVDGTTGGQSLTRITTLAGLECESENASPSAMTGSWFDRTHDGEGLAVEILNNGRALVYWFSYDKNGNQAWFYGTGQQDGSIISIPNMQITSGGQFGPDFDPEQVERAPWGGLVVGLECDYGKFDYTSEIDDFGSGKQTLTRLTSVGDPECSAPDYPNILLVIADDVGKDASNQYDISEQQPVTPTLDLLADNGLVFENAWSSPTCSPTRAGILTGKYATRTGVFTPGDELSEDETSLQSYIREHLPGKYADAVIGKWHLGPQPGGLDHPENLGISHFAGMIGGGVDDYEDWNLVVNGQRSEETTYTTTKLVDLAIEWTATQQDPWFLWLAFNAPHTPFHLPPTDLHSRDLAGTEGDIEADPLPYYFAAIEAMDTELGRFLDSLDTLTRENTIIIFMGDNGTPGEVVQSPYARRKSKGSLYQGGVNIPFFATGPGITRVGEREASLINTLDLFGTIAELAGVNIDQVNDSISFTKLFEETQQTQRFFQFSETSNDGVEQWAISDGMYKLVDSSDGEKEVYHLTSDPFEVDDLEASGSAPAEVVDDLQYLVSLIRDGSGEAKQYAIVDTGQSACYDTSTEMVCPASGEALYGQDAQYAGNTPGFTDNGDGTVTDQVTGITWQQSPNTDLDGDIDAGDKLSFDDAQAYCNSLELAGSDDWRVPDIKQLYSLIDFKGLDPSGYEGEDTSGLVPFIDNSVFEFGWGDTGAGERIIDAQFATTSLYVSTTGPNNAETMFGVNFADGRIKGYGLTQPGQGTDKTFYVLCARGSESYGQNELVDNADGTITDQATGLMWAAEDSTTGLNWEQALAWVEQQNGTDHLGYSDWRLPNAKELQSLVDYSRSPDTSNSAAIDPLFNATAIVNEGGVTDYPAYWTGTTHLNSSNNPGASAVYVNFGRALGYMDGAWVDIHGAGAQRSDPKAGDPADYPTGRGPQGDAIRIYNQVRLVRNTQ